MRLVVFSINVIFGDIVVMKCCVSFWKICVVTQGSAISKMTPVLQTPTWVIDPSCVQDGPVDSAVTEIGISLIGFCIPYFN